MPFDNNAHAKTERATIRTPIARLSYPNLFTKRAYEDGDPKYSCSLIFDPAAQKTDEFAKMKAAAAECARQKWGEKAKTLTLRSPFRNGDEKGKDGYIGNRYINVSSMQKPQIVGGTIDPATGKLVVITDTSLVYPGMYVRASVSPYPYEKKGNRGIAFGLRHIQLVRDGEPLGGVTFADDDFEPLDEQAAHEASDPESLFA